MDKIQTIDEGFSKCRQCIKEGINPGAEKPVIVFEKFGVCLCEKHLNDIISNYVREVR